MPRQGRRGKPAPSPVANWPPNTASRCCGLRRPNTAEFVAELRDLAPDACAVVAYGALLRADLLAVPRARVGEPALLAVAGLARGRPGAGRDRRR